MSQKLYPYNDLGNLTFANKIVSNGCLLAIDFPIDNFQERELLKGVEIVSFKGFKILQNDLCLLVWEMLPYSHNELVRIAIIAVYIRLTEMRVLIGVKIRVFLFGGLLGLDAAHFA